jgi:hypothetical protein
MEGGTAGARARARRPLRRRAGGLPPRPAAGRLPAGRARRAGGRAPRAPRRHAWPAGATQHADAVLARD